MRVLIFFYVVVFLIDRGSSMCSGPGHVDVVAISDRSANVISNSAPVPHCIQCATLTPSFQIITDPDMITYSDVSTGVIIMNDTLNGVTIFDDGLLIEDPAGSFSTGGVRCQFNGQQLQHVITFNIFVFVSPPITPNGTVLDYVEGDNVTLMCTGDSDIANDFYQWTLPDGTKEPLNAVLADNGLPLELKNVTRTDSGVYTCTGSISVAGQAVEVESNATLNIQFTAKLFSFTSNDTILPVTNTVTLNCSYEGNPTPSTIWTHNDTVLDPQSDPNLSQTINNGYTLLEITFTSIDDSGNYSCGVNNSVGNDPSGLIAVIAQVAPGPVATLLNGSSTTQSITVSWSFGFNGNSPITGVEITYNAVSNFGPNLNQGVSSGTASTDDPIQTSITIFDLQPLTTYEVNVTVQNEVFGTVGASSVESVEASTLPLVPNKPAVTGVEPINSTALRITWTANTTSYTQTDIERFGILYNNVGNSTLNSYPVEDPLLRTLDIVNLLKGTFYEVRIISENSAGPSPESDINSGRTDIDPPSAVRNLQPTSNPFSICVQWDEPEDNGGQAISGYDIYLWNRDENEMENYTFVISVGANMLTYTIENLDNETDYNIRVAAKNMESGQGENSTTNAITGQPLQVDQDFVVNITNITAISAIVSWTVQSDNIQFRLQFTTADDEFDPGMYTNLTGTTFSHTIRGLDPRINYMVRMTRIEGGGCTRRVSEISTFTTRELEVEVEGPESITAGGEPIVLVCRLNTGDNATDVEWSRIGDTIPSNAVIRNHTLTIHNPTVNDTGNYTCTSRRGTENATFTFSLLINPAPEMSTPSPSPSPNITFTPTSEPKSSSLPIWVIIVIAVGAFFCFLFFIVMLIVCLYCCCRNKSEKDSAGRYDLAKPPKKSSGMWLDQGASGFSSVIPTSAEPKDNELTKNVSYVSCNVPLDSSEVGGASDTGIKGKDTEDAPVGRGRTMTNDYASATSFNTIDKKGSTEKLYTNDPLYENEEKVQTDV